MIFINRSIKLCLYLSFFGLFSTQTDLFPGKKSKAKPLESQQNIKISSVEALRDFLNENVFSKRREDKTYYFLTDLDGVLCPQGGSEKENIDPVFAQIIKDLKSKNVVVGAITNRNDSESKKSLKAFDQAFGGFNLLKIRGANNNWENRWGQKSLFKKGIFYVGHIFNKGRALEIIFERIIGEHYLYGKKEKPNPKDFVLIYVDDSPKNLKKIRAAAEKIGIGKIITIHYLASDQSMDSVKKGGFLNGIFQNKMRRFVRDYLPESVEESFF